MRLSALSFIGISSLLLIACNTSSQSGIKVPEVIQPGEQAPFADPGQRNFGGFRGETQQAMLLHHARDSRYRKSERYILTN